jgi:DNA topoisomerase II
MNFFRHFWPCLLKPTVDAAEDEGNEDPPFLSSFITPLLKVSKKGVSSKKHVLSFFSQAEYNVWRASIDPDEIRKWNVKYYKGLGTSTPAEAKEYFSTFDNHFRPFLWNSDIDGEVSPLLSTRGLVYD